MNGYGSIEPSATDDAPPSSTSSSSSSSFYLISSGLNEMLNLAWWTGGTGAAGTGSSPNTFRAVSSGPTSNSRSPMDVHSINADIYSSETESLLAKELTQLSVQEREQVFHDVHGVSEVLKETPELLEAKLLELDYELSLISIKLAYEQARALSEEYTTGRTFRLMFLRAEKFHAKNAAARMVLYFEEKLKLFGRDKLARDIRLNDLDSDDMACLKSGYLTPLPGRDRAGRAVIFATAKLRAYRTPENMVRTIISFLFYILFYFLILCSPIG